VLAFYYNLTDVILLGQVYYYRKFSRRSPREDELINDSELTPLVRRHNNPPAPPAYGETRTVFSHVLEFVASISCLCITGIISYYLSVTEKDAKDSDSLMLRIGTFKLHDNSTAQHVLLFAQFLGWGSAVLYLGSRIPQIVKNFKNRSCEGLSLAMFYFSVLGNLTYCLSILFHSVERKFILINLPWLIGSGGTLFFDFMIFFQFYLYRNSTKLSSVLLERKQMTSQIV